MTDSSDSGQNQNDSENGNGDSESDIQTLQITRNMGRAVIDHQIDSLSDLNDKAAYTIRLNILILGVLLTVFSLLLNNNQGQNEITNHVINGGVGTGVFLSSFSILAALWTYTSTRKEVGPTGESMMKAINNETGYSARGWLRGTIQAQAGWIQTNDKVNRRDSFMLFISHLYLFISIGFYAFGITWGLRFANKPLYYYWLSVLVLSTVLPSIVLAPKYAPKDKIPEGILNSISEAIDDLMDNK